MAVTDIATRTYNHNWRLDPIVRSLLDTDFYKLLMLQMIRHLYPDVRATFQLINRSKAVRLADDIDLLAPDSYWTANYDTIDKIAGPCRDWTLDQGKPFAIWETGWQTTGQADPGYTEDQRTARVQGTIDYWRAAGAEYVLWFEAKKTDDNLIEGHPGALAAYAAAVQGK